MLRLRTRHSLIAATVAAMVLSGSPAGAETYPANKITLIVAFAPGGIADGLITITTKTT